jgi:hypothetical protein
VLTTVGSVDGDFPYSAMSETDDGSSDIAQNRTLSMVITRDDKCISAEMCVVIFYQLVILIGVATCTPRYLRDKWSYDQIASFSL